jgi:restriction system protein
MSLWLFRAGSGGEYERLFLDEGRVYLTWQGLKHDLSKVKNKKWRTGFRIFANLLTIG